MEKLKKAVLIERATICTESQLRDSKIPKSIWKVCRTVRLLVTLSNRQQIDLFQVKRLGTWARFTEQRLFTKTYASKNPLWPTATRHVPETLKVIRFTAAVLLTAGAQMTSFWDVHETDLSHCPSYFIPNAGRSGKS